MKNLFRIPFAMFIASLMFLSCSKDDAQYIESNKDIHFNSKITSHSTTDPFTIAFGKVTYAVQDNVIKVYEDGVISEEILTSSDEYTTSNYEELPRAVALTNLTSNKRKIMHNIRLSEDKKIITYDLKDENGYIFKDFEIIGETEFPELPVSSDACCDWDAWFNATAEIVKAAIEKSKQLARVIGQSAEHMAQHAAGAASPCPEGTGRTYGYDSNGRPFSKCE